MRSAWLYRDWSKRWPSIGCDEYHRHTVVLPWPIRRLGTYDPDLGWSYYALVVALPWYKCRTCEEQDAAYFHVADGDIARTVEAGDRALLDLAADGSVLGVELLTLRAGEYIVCPESMKASDQ